MPSWWGWGTENTRDRATAHLPALLYERLDEFGIDFTILYPSMTLSYLEIHDDELDRAAVSRREPLRSRTSSRPPRPHDRRRAGTDARPEDGDRRARVRGPRARLQDRGVRRPRAPFDRKPTVAYRLDTFGVDSAFDYDPLWAKCVELGVAPVFHIVAAMASGDAIGDELRLQPHRRLGGEPRVAVQVAVPVGRDASLPDVALRVPRGRRGLGLQPVLRHRRSLGEAQRARRSARSTPICSTSTRSSRCSTATATSASGAHSKSSARTSRARPRARAARRVRGGRMRRSVEDIRDRFVPNFYFGCEADDRLVAWAFAERCNPLGRAAPSDLRLRHLALGRARHDPAGRGGFELVEDGVIGEVSSEELMFLNPARLHAGMNPAFFDGTVCERAVRSRPVT